MEEILATASNWLFSSMPKWCTFVWYMISCSGMIYGLYKLYQLDDLFRLYGAKSTNWDYGTIDPMTGLPYKVSNPPLAPKTTKKPVSNSNIYDKPTKKPKYPPKPIFFGRLNGKDIRIEGPGEEEYLTYWQKYDWKEWERTQALTKVKEKAKNILSQASSGGKHEQKELFKDK